MEKGSEGKSCWERRKVGRREGGKEGKKENTIGFIRYTLSILQFCTWGAGGGNGLEIILFLRTMGKYPWYSSPNLSGWPWKWSSKSFNPNQCLYEVLLWKRTFFPESSTSFIWVRLRSRFTSFMFGGSSLPKAVKGADGEGRGRRSKEEMWLYFCENESVSYLPKIQRTSEQSQCLPQLVNVSDKDSPKCVVYGLSAVRICLDERNHCVLGSRKL